MNYASYDDVIKIVQGVAKKVPQGIMQGNCPVGTLTWQYTLMEDFIACDGSVVNDASIQYPELLAFAQTHSLVTADTSKTYLFQYASTNDIMTLPDLRDMTVWGGSSVDKKEAGLPNITGNIYANGGDSPTGRGVFRSASGVFTVGTKYDHIFSMDTGATYNNVYGNVDIDASRLSSIYGNSTTVQPPAIQLIPQIKYRTSTSVFNTINAGRFVATAPVHYEREDLFTTNKTTITIKPTWVNIDGIGFVLEGQKTIDINNSSNWDNSSYATASNRAGKDFYIYCVYTSPNNIEPEFILSANSTIPTGYTANTSRKIGGFHTLCLSVGTISGHTLSGYVTGDILPASAWDLNFRAVAENEGMVWIPQIGLWADIYLGSWNGSKLVSAYNGVPVTGTSSKAMHGIMMAEEYGLVNKCLPSYDNFIIAAKGTPEGSHISTDAVPTGAGGHIDKSSRRIISNYGLEDCCGVLWQWGRDCPEHYLASGGNATTYRGAYWDGTNPYLTGYNWHDIPVYNSTVDSVKRGSCGGLLRRLVFGGGYGYAVAYCGSRAVYGDAFGTLLGVNIGGRGFSKVR